VSALPEPPSASEPAPLAATTASPFARVPDPRAYVPRPACEEALTGLRGALAEGARTVVLEGPPGIGKSLLLRVLESRVDGRFEVVRLPLARVGFDQLAAIALASLDPRSAARPAVRLDEAARRLRTVGKVLVVAVDDAARLPPDVAEALARALRAGRGALRVVLAVATGAARPRLPGGTRTIRLAQPMSELETARYVEARIARDGAPALARAFPPAVVAELHARSGGVPGPLHELARPIADAALRAVGGAAAARASPPAGARAAPNLVYVPRAETERVLGDLLRALRAGRRAQLVRGGSGLGKSTLLRELGARLPEPMQAVEILYAQLEPADFFAWVLHQIGAPPPERPAELELREVAARFARVGGALVLLVDEAQSLPAGTVARLVEVVAGAGGALRVVAALDVEIDPGPLRALPELLEHRLERPLDEVECAALLDARLRGAPEALRAHFARAGVRDLLRASRGNPRALEHLLIEQERTALAAARGGGLAPDAPATPGGAAPATRAHAPSRPLSLPAPPRALAQAAPPARPAEAASASSARAAPPPRAGAALDAEGALAVAPPPVALRLAAPLALGAGVPLALFALWLWLAPLFSASSAPARVTVLAPAGTSVALDGRLLGTAPLAPVELERGVHRLRAVVPGTGVVERRVVVWTRDATIRLP